MNTTSTYSIDYRSCFGAPENYTVRYRYAFNGKEQDLKWNGVGAMHDYGFRIYDPRIAKFLSVDPLANSYPWYTPYQYAGNKPIVNVDLDGLEDYNYIYDLIDYFIGEAERQVKSYVINKATYLTASSVHAIKEKVNEQTLVYDLSVETYLVPGVPKVVQVGPKINLGFSYTLNLGGDKTKNGLFFHSGFGNGIDSGSSAGAPIPTITFSAGIVGGNFNQASDYSGSFIDGNASFCGIGAGHCYWPGGAIATYVSFTPQSLFNVIETEGVPNASATLRYDYYWLVYTPESASIEESLPISNVSIAPAEQSDKTLISFDYAIKAGDTLGELADKFDTPISVQQKDNDIQNVDKIYEGGTLRVNTAKNTNNINRQL